MKILSKLLLASFLTFIGMGESFAQKPSHASSQNQGFIPLNKGSLYYEEVGQGTPIVVVHGGPGMDQEYLKPHLLPLASDYRLIFYDQRGSGKSLTTPLDEKHINLTQFVEDLEALRQSLGLKRFILMGHSWGGLLAMQYAISYQDHLLGLILINTGPADYKGQKAFMEEVEVRTANIFNDIKELFSYEDFKKLNATQISLLYQKLFSVYCYDPQEIQRLNLKFAVPSAQSGFRVMEEMTKTSWLHPSVNLFPKLKTLPVPTFILHGKQDVVPVWTAEEIKEAIPYAEIAVLDHCGHFSYIEQPLLFFNELRKFLSKVTTRKCYKTHKS